MPLIGDPIDWELDDDDQLIIPIRYVTGLKAIRQGVKFRLNIAKGEWFLNLDIGVPYLATEDGVVSESEALLGDFPFDRAKVHAAIRKEIETTPGVVQVTNITATFEGSTRTMTVVWSARTAFGELQDVTLELEIAA